MTKETINKEFDDELEKILPKEQWGIFRYEWVKQFIHQQIEKVINELLPQEMNESNLGYLGELNEKHLARNMIRKEIIKKAQEMGYKL